MMNIKTTFLITLVLLALTACSPASPDISGEWKLVSYGNAASPMLSIPNVETSIKFEDGQLSGNVGCNRFGGAYELKGDKINFSRIMSTRMFCEEISVQEQGVLSVISDNLYLQLQLNGDALTIMSTDGSTVINLARK